MSAAAALWAEVERNRSQPCFCVLQFNEASAHRPFQRETLYSPWWVCKFLKSKEQFQPFKFTFNYQWVRRKMLPSKLKSNESLPLALKLKHSDLCTLIQTRVHSFSWHTHSALCTLFITLTLLYVLFSVQSRFPLCLHSSVHSGLCKTAGLCTLWFVHSLHLLCTQTHSGLCTHLFHEVKCCQGNPQEQVFSPGLLRSFGIEDRKIISPLPWAFSGGKSVELFSPTNSVPWRKSMIGSCSLRKQAFWRRLSAVSCVFNTPLACDDVEDLSPCIPVGWLL